MTTKSTDLPTNPRNNGRPHQYHAYRRRFLRISSSIPQNGSRAPEEKTRRGSHSFPSPSLEFDGKETNNPLSRRKDSFRFLQAHRAGKETNPRQGHSSLPQATNGSSEASTTNGHTYSDQYYKALRYVTSEQIKALSRVTESEAPAPRKAEIEAEEDAQHVPFRPMTMREAMTSKEATEDIPWIVENILAEGDLGVWSAYAKVGKTTMVYELLLAVARGKPFLDCPTTQGAVLLLAVEESRRRVIRRLVHKLGAHQGDPIHIWAKPLTVEMLPEVQAYIKKHHIKLVVLDTLSTYWSRYLASEHDNNGIIRVLTPFRELVQQAEVAFLAIHHERKGGGIAGEGLRGGSASFAQLDQLVICKRVKGHPTQRRLEFIGRNDESPTQLLIDYVPIKGAATTNGVTPRHHISLGTPEATDDHTLTARIKSALGSGSKDMPELVELTGTKRKALDALLASLLKAGRVSRRGAGRKGDPFVWTWVTTKKKKKKAA